MIGLPRTLRLRKSADFKRVQASGHKIVTSHIIVYVAPTPPAEPSPAEPCQARLGLTVSSRVGGSVERNLIKRRLREVFRRLRQSLPMGQDWVLIARPTILAVPYEAIAADLERIRLMVQRRRPSFRA